MENRMFCFQCEQTAGCKGCMGAAGVCGKKADVAGLQDQLTGALIGLVRSTEGNEHLISDSTSAVMVESLFATLTNVNFDPDHFYSLLDWADAEKRKKAVSWNAMNIHQDDKQENGISDLMAWVNT